MYIYCVGGVSEKYRPIQGWDTARTLKVGMRRVCISVDAENVLYETDVGERVLECGFGVHGNALG